MRSVLAILVGYALMAILVVAASGLLMTLYPNEFQTVEGTPRPPASGWYLLNLVYSFAFAFLAGDVTARIARRAEWRHGLTLAGLMAVMSIATIATAPAEIPLGWTLGELGVGVAGILLAARRRARASAGRRGPVASTEAAAAAPENSGAPTAS